VDGMVRQWVRLHGRGTPASEAELRAAAQEAVGGEGPAGERGAAAPDAEPSAAPPRRPGLVEDLL